MFLNDFLSEVWYASKSRDVLKSDDTPIDHDQKDGGVDGGGGGDGDGDHADCERHHHRHGRLGPHHRAEHAHRGGEWRH